MTILTSWSEQLLIPSWFEQLLIPSGPHDRLCYTVLCSTVSWHWGTKGLPAYKCTEEAINSKGPRRDQ